MKKGTAPAIIGVIVLVGVLLGLGFWSSKTTPSSDEDNQQANQQNSQQSSSTPSTDPADKPVANLKGVLVESLLPTQTIGDPNTAKTKITIGYTFDTATQSRPEKAATIVNAVRDWATKQGSKASLQLVCMDLPPDQLSGANASYAKIPLGISINGQQPPGFNANPGEGTYTASTVLKALGGS